MADIVKQYTKFIFPFTFVPEALLPEQAKIQSKKNKPLPLFTPFAQGNESLREGLADLLSNSGCSAQIARCLQLNVDYRKYIHLPPHPEDTLEFHPRQADVAPQQVAITNIKLYLFESQVGFLELECAYSSTSIEMFSTLNYYIGEIKSKKNHFALQEKSWDAETKQATWTPHEFSVKELIDRILQQICFDRKDGELVPAEDPQQYVAFSYDREKPLVYSYLLLSDKPDDIGDLLFHLNKNYKETYLYDASCTKVDTLHPFENSYWTASLNGASNISYLTENETTNAFFKDQFYQKTKDVYYFLFLNVIHQRHAIARTMGEIGHLDKLGKDYAIMHEQLRRARTCEENAVNLKFRAFFKYPSTVIHVNEYYDLLQKTFAINDLYNNFTQEIKNLTTICNTYVERIKQRETKLKKRKAAWTEIFVSLFGTIVAEITLFNNSWTLIERFFGHPLEIWSVPFFILVVAVISPLFAVITNIKKQWDEIKVLSEALYLEENDGQVEDDKTRRKKVRAFMKEMRKNHKNRKPYLYF